MAKQTPKSSIPTVDFGGTLGTYTSQKGTEYKVISGNVVMFQGQPHKLYTSTQYETITLDDGRKTSVRMDVIRLLPVEASAPAQERSYVAGKNPPPSENVKASAADARIDKLEAVLSALVAKLTPAK